MKFMSNFAEVSRLLLSLLVFLFFFWRGLFQEFASKTVFQSGVIILSLFSLGAVAAKVLIPLVLPSSNIFFYSGSWFWGAIFGLSLGFSAAFKFFKLPFYEALEATVVGFLFSIPILSGEWVYAIVTLFLYYFVFKKYKSFSWYKSGKIGFAGLCAMGTFFALRSLLAFSGSALTPVTGIGKVEVVIGAALSFLSFFAVYNLSDQ